MKISSENLDKPAITTKDIMSNKKEITYVVYDSDGDWQFLSNEEVSEEDAMVVSVGQVLEKDPSLFDLPEIEKNDEFTRINKQSQWVKLKS